MERGRRKLDTQPRTARFSEKHERILGAAADLINSQGVHGMTLADVADRVGLNTTSVTYYFGRKEQLAVACYDRAIERIGAIIARAADAPTLEARVRRLVTLHLDEQAAIIAGDRVPVAVLSEVRTLEEPARAQILRNYNAQFRSLRGLIGADVEGDIDRRHWLSARASVLAEAMLWLPFWIGAYDPADFPRVADRLSDIILHGVALPDAIWAPGPMDLSTGASDGQTASASRDAFLRAATETINMRGYRGASVARIASQLNVTKGSFYHHLAAKDELVLACFRRSFDMIAQSQLVAMRTNAGDMWTGFCSSVAALLDEQFGDGCGLMRSTALQVLPRPLRAIVLEQNGRLARRYADMLCDGMADGSVRPVDCQIAAQVVIGAINAAVDMRWWSKHMPRAQAVEMTGRCLAFGIGAY